MRSQLLAIILLIAFLVGVSSTLALYSMTAHGVSLANQQGKSSVDSSITFFAVLDDGEESHNTMFAIIFISLSLLFLANLFFLFYTGKLFRRIEDSDKALSRDVGSLKKTKYDGLKETVMTRNVILDKLNTGKAM